MENIHQNQKVYFLVIEYIKEMVQEGRLSFGGKIPSERELMGTLGLGRNSVREALRSLENIGLIESRHGKGNYLVNRMGRSLNEIFSMLLFMKESSCLEINQLRRGIEIQAFLMAVQKASPEGTEKLKKALKAMETGEKPWEIMDKEFHDSLTALSGNHLFQILMESMSGLSRAAINAALEKTGDQERSQLLECHREILLGICQKDAKRGVEALQRHYDMMDECLGRNEKENRVETAKKV